MWIFSFHSVSAQTLGPVHQAAVQWANDFLGTTMAPLWPTQTQCTGVETDELNPANGRNSAQDRTTIDIKGTGTGLQLPQRGAVVVGLRTALPTRAGRGRFYVPIVDSTHLTADGDLASADAFSIAQGCAQAFTTFSGTAAPVVYHRATFSFTDVTAVTVGVVFGSQRRRTNKVANAYTREPI